MSEVYAGKKGRFHCPKCGKEVSGWETKYKNMAGKEVVHVKLYRHKCE